MTSPTEATARCSMDSATEPAKCQERAICSSTERTECHAREKTGQVEEKLGISTAPSGREGCSLSTQP